MLKIILGLAIALCIGAACRYFDIPIPAPPKLLGALLILAMTVGYIGTDYLLQHQTREAAAAESAPSSESKPHAGP